MFWLGCECIVMCLFSVVILVCIIFMLMLCLVRVEIWDCVLKLGLKISLVRCVLFYCFMFGNLCCIVLW